MHGHQPTSEPPPLSADVAPSHTVSIERTVLRINTLTRLYALELSMAVGQIIVEDIYGGDLEAWRRRGPKETSFRKLARHPDMQLSASALARSVAIYEMCTRVGVSTWRHLGVSHLRAVTALPEPQQRPLLERADRERWTVREVEAHCRGTRPLKEGAARRGRRPMPQVVKRLQHINRMIDDATSDDFDDALLAEWPVERLYALLNDSEQKLHKLREICETLDQRIDAYESK